jgi:hypothetical protein
MENEQIYRPLLQSAYKRVALQIAKKLNETALQNWSDLDVCRLALAELWKRAYPDAELPSDAQALLQRYDADPNIVQSA